MKIGIVIAIERELKAFLESKFEVETIVDGPFSSYKTVVNGNEVFAIRSGYGVIDASSKTQYLITKFGCEVILNFGVAGAIVEGLNVSDLFIVNKAVNYDYDVSPIDPVKLHQYEEYEDEFIKLDEGLIQKAKEIMPSLKDITCASGDRFINDRLTKDMLALETTGSICDMEVGAIARVSLNNKVRSLSIKCISDTIDGDGSDFQKNVIASAKKAFSFIENFLYKI